MRAQARGQFEDGAGTFYGKETCKGKTYRMRFLWKHPSDDTAVWEQAYQNPASGEWETNWIMEFQRCDA